MVVETLYCTTEIGAERPIHAACGKPMAKWRFRAGRQRWVCTRVACNPKWVAATRPASYRSMKSENGREISRRYRRGNGYITTRRRLLLAQRERVTNQLEEIREELNAWL